jgi:hypothetical protein
MSWAGNLGPLYEDDENHSPGRANAKGIVIDTAANIMAIADTKQVGGAMPLDTGSGLVAGVLYVPIYNTNMVRTGWRAVHGKHKHDADTDEAGGTLFDIQFANLGNIMLMSRWLAPIPEDFIVSKVGTGVLQRKTSGEYGLELQTSATNNDLTTARGVGLRYDWDAKLTLQFKSDTSHGSGLLARMGINTDRVEDSQDTARRQMGIEGCDGHGANWIIINANGNTSSLTPTPTTAPVLEASKKAHALVHIPATEVRLYVEEVSVGVSTTNVASSSVTDPERLFIWGMKTTSGGVAKEIELRTALVCGKPSSNQFLSIV